MLKVRGLQQKWENLIPEFKDEFEKMADNRFRGVMGFNDAQRKDALESLSGMVKLIQGLKNGKHGMEALSQEEFDKVTMKLIPYANFACADGAVSKLQEALFTIESSQSAGMSGILYDAKIANLDLFAQELRILHVYPDGPLYYQTACDAIGVLHLNRFQLVSQEVHDKIYLKRLVSDELQVERTGDADHYVTKMEAVSGQEKKKSVFLDYLDTRFSEKMTAIGIVNRLTDDLFGDKPLLPSENDLGDHYNQQRIDDFMGLLEDTQKKCNYSGGLFKEIVDIKYPPGTTQEEIDDVMVLPIAFEYKANADVIIRLAAITGAVNNGYLDGDFKVMTCPSTKALVMDAIKYGININRECVDLGDVLLPITAKIPQMDGVQKCDFYFKLESLKGEIDGQDLSPKKKAEWIERIQASQGLLNTPEITKELEQHAAVTLSPETIATLEQRNIARLFEGPEASRQRAAITQLFEGNDPETIARILEHQLKAPQAAKGGEPGAAEAAQSQQQISSAALRAFCDPKIIEKMEKVVEIMEQRSQGNYSSLGDLLDKFVNMINTLIGKGVTVAKLQENIDIIQEASTAYKQLVGEEQATKQEMEKPLGFADRINQARANPQPQQPTP